MSPICRHRRRLRLRPEIAEDKEDEEPHAATRPSHIVCRSVRRRLLRLARPVADGDYCDLLVGSLFVPERGRRSQHDVADADRPVCRTGGQPIPRPSRHGGAAAGRRLRGCPGRSGPPGRLFRRGAWRPSTLARGRISPRRRRRRQVVGGQRQQTGRRPEDGRLRGPVRHARRSDGCRAEQRGLCLQSAIRRGAPGREFGGQRGAAAYRRDPQPAEDQRADDSSKSPPAPGRTCRRATRSALGRRSSCAPSRATALCRA